MNLNNLVRGLQKLYLPKRRSLVEQMEQQHGWDATAQRFKTFQRSESGLRKPSEWMIIVFALLQMGRIGLKRFRLAWGHFGDLEK